LFSLDAYQGAYRPDFYVASSDSHEPAHVGPFCRMNILIALLIGALMGGLNGVAKGAFKSKDAPYVVPMSIVTGLITGVLLANFAF
jgi:hypothetical protein